MKQGKNKKKKGYSLKSLYFKFSLAKGGVFFASIVKRILDHDSIE